MSIRLRPIGKKPNQMELNINNHLFLFSYGNLVACCIDKQYYIVDKKVSITTQKHINNWVDYNYFVISQEELENKLLNLST